MRRRRVLAALVLLNLVELVGVGLVSSGFWVGFAATVTVLLAYLVHLRQRALVAARRRRARERRLAWIAAEQAAVRREHSRRAAERAAARAQALAERDRVPRRGALRDPSPPRAARGTS